MVMVNISLKETPQRRMSGAGEILTLTDSQSVMSGTSLVSSNFKSFIYSFIHSFVLSFIQNHGMLTICHAMGIIQIRYSPFLKEL